LGPGCLVSCARSTYVPQIEDHCENLYGPGPFPSPRSHRTRPPPFGPIICFTLAEAKIYVNYFVGVNSKASEKAYTLLDSPTARRAWRRGPWPLVLEPRGRGSIVIREDVGYAIVMKSLVNLPWWRSYRRTGNAASSALSAWNILTMSASLIPELTEGITLLGSLVPSEPSLSH
jgi:hypothetical protein